MMFYRQAFMQYSSIPIFSSWVQSPKSSSYIWFLASIINTTPKLYYGRQQMERRLHSRAVGESKTADALLLFLRVRSVIWRYGSPSRTKSQGQISWLWRENSWEEQTRKLLHFIKDPAGEQQSFSSSPPTLSITPLLPPVCHYIHNTRFPSPVLLVAFTENMKSPLQLRL